MTKLMVFTLAMNHNELHINITNTKGVECEDSDSLTCSDCPLFDSHNMYCHSKLFNGITRQELQSLNFLYLANRTLQEATDDNNI